MAARRITRTSSPPSSGPGRAGGARLPGGARRHDGACLPGGAAEKPTSPEPETPDIAIARSRLPGAAWLARSTRRLGIVTVRDLLYHLPRKYADLTQLYTLGQLGWLEPGTAVSVRATVQDLRVEPTFRRRIERTTAYLVDPTGSAQAVWFGRRFIQNRLKVGDRVVLGGKLRFRGSAYVIDNPEFQVDVGDEVLLAGRIVPVYRTTSGLTATRLRTAIHDALELYAPGLDEYLPPDVRAKASVIGLADALRQVHFPDDDVAKDAALRRLAFDELLALQVGMVGRRRARARETAARVNVDGSTDASIREAIVAALRLRNGDDVSLTPDQHAAMEAIRRDLAGVVPMERLLQGDVGSGKTAVAAYALAAVAMAGGQAALLAPTDLLARQHATTIAELVAGAGLEVALLTGSLRSAETRDVRERMAAGAVPIVVGTHALISEGVAYARLRLAVVDEQHRFGVAQRDALRAKATEGDPHVLLMTATPIPRTLGQVFYADLDVSDLRTPPAGRVPIRTGIRRPGDLDGTWERVRLEASAGRRTFVVVPAIEESEDDPDAAVAATAEADRLRTLLSPLRVGLIHGRMKAADRDAEMTRFRDGGIDVLVGTTVVEVGVDVPEASMMIVEGADRFGLAQLHQLRGRVGRGTAESFCVLVSDVEPDTTAYARLEAVRSTRDGFVLAEADFDLRREGDVLGLEQSGLPRLRVASLGDPGHRELALVARRQAEALVGGDGALAGPRTTGLRRELRSGWLARIAAGETDEIAGDA